MNHRLGGLGDCFPEGSIIRNENGRPSKKSTLALGDRVGVQPDELTRDGVPHLCIFSVQKGVTGYS